MWSRLLEPQVSPTLLLLENRSERIISPDFLFTTRRNDHLKLIRVYVQMLYAEHCVTRSITRVEYAAIHRVIAAPVIHASIKLLI